MDRRLLIPLAAATLLISGCYDEEATNAPAPQAPPPYTQQGSNPGEYPRESPPPPPARGPVYRGEVPPLIQLADRNGFRAGSDDGARDAYYRAGYAPRADRKYADAPGYDYRLGPIPPYVEEFRRAYRRGYEWGYNGAGR